MNKQELHKATPPRWATRFLRWYCRSELIDEVEGDLYELFQRRVEEQGPWKAKVLYWLNVLMFLHPDYIRKRKESYSQNHTAMLQNYFTSAYRNLTKRVSYTLINILGLSIGLTASLCIALLVFHEFSYDQNHAHAKRMYRVETQKIRPEGTDTYAGAPLGVASALRTDFSEVEAATNIVYWHDQLIGVPATTNKFRENIAFANPSLFLVFDYHFIAGDKNTALSEPNTVLLTEEAIRKHFNYTQEDEITEAIGKVIQLNNEIDLKVDGILKDYPINTSFPFNLIVSFSTLKSMNPDFKDDGWGGWSDNDQTYIVLEEGVKAEQLEQLFPAMIEKYKGEGASKERGHELVPLKDIHFSYNYSGRSADKDSLYNLSLIGLFLLIIASINFINLSTAQATKRSKEVGVRKVLGGSRKQLIFQFMSEAGLIAFSSFLIALVMIVVLLPYASHLLGINLSFSALFEPQYIAFIISSYIVVSLLSGLYPALVLSRYLPVSALKSKVSTVRTRGFTLRHGMVTLQFIICQVLLIGTVVVSRQIYLFTNADLGFNSESIITTNLPERSTDKLETLRNQLLQIPQIEDVSFSFNSASAESNFMGELLYKTDSGEVSIRAQFKLADHHFLDTYGINLTAGEPLQERDTSGQILVNEVFVKKMGLSSPDHAVGEFIDNSYPRLNIKGVVEDFHVNSLHQEIDPTIIVISPQHYHQAGIKVKAENFSETNLHSTISQLQSTWAVAFPEYVFSYQFLDETLAQAYKKERQMMWTTNLFSGVAIFISCLGLYGLISFMAVQRTKEVGIRKVLGASVGQIVQLFSKELVVLLFIAFLIAVPLGYFFMQKWLANFAFRIEIGWWTYALSGITALLIALSTVSYQSLKAALANPVDSLRNE